MSTYRSFGTFTTLWSTAQRLSPVCNQAKPVAARCAVRCMVTKTTPVKDGNTVESRAFIHERDSGEVVLSYLEDDTLARGPAVIGWLKRGCSVTPANFEDNKEFIRFFQKVVGDNIVDDEDHKYLAQMIDVGWMHVNDPRNPPYQNRIAEHEDILGSVRVAEGKMVPGTYEPMPVHRVVSPKGLMRLQPFLHDRLLRAYSEI
ncbi:hypothetical protein SARC_00335 [Sphaeroforma arctica JP610]|uniref:Uncharacterized protein n=1 Tax=Sphaeroforma arctica JP610 TaxID=667725 RepID=A0A0L0GEY1_9EUKA|nr:hypothetical protein SARC_00335 [Sphaeroforma arctica JP610]KNC87570.1 hypothetical protein SARC_00335 [Sphaeroforma arctica JP610]|eukprot:XP_014161472.1 hypothetical protein SARC_00335 [Sphaeroforma arctica JP610]